MRIIISGSRFFIMEILFSEIFYIMIIHENCLLVNIMFFVIFAPRDKYIYDEKIKRKRRGVLS